MCATAHEPLGQERSGALTIGCKQMLTGLLCFQFDQLYIGTYAHTRLQHVWRP